MTKTLTTLTLKDVRMFYQRWQDLREAWPDQGITLEQVKEARDLFEQALAQLEENRS